jgi:hypothetical protein
MKDAIEFFHQPNAVTDGDSLVYFREGGPRDRRLRYPVRREYGRVDDGDVRRGGVYQSASRARETLI